MRFLEIILFYNKYYYSESNLQTYLAYEIKLFNLLLSSATDLALNYLNIT